MPQSSSLVSGNYSEACDGNRCFEMPLATAAGASQYSMVGSGYETAVKLSDVRVATSSGACVSGCDFAAAGEATQNMLWRYDASINDYVNISSPAGSLDPWAGYWVNTPNTASSLAPKLLIPVPGSYMN